MIPYGQHEAAICPKCNTYYTKRLTVMATSNGTCSCSTGECTCGTSYSYFCPHCGGQGHEQIIYVLDSFSGVAQKKEEEPVLGKPGKGSPWLGEKRNRQRTHNMYRRKQQFRIDRRVQKRR